MPAPRSRKAAQLAADEINAKGGIKGRKVQIITYDDHSSAADAVRAFQRAVNQDKVDAVIGSYISEVVLAIEPWSARLHEGRSSRRAPPRPTSPKHVHDDYAHYKYTFHGWLTSAFIAQSICDFSKDMLVKDFHMKTAVVMSEDAAWTTPLDARYLECLPKAGLKVLDHIRFNPDTTDFTPIFNKIEGAASGRDHHRHQPCRRAADGAVARPAGADRDGRAELAGDHLDLLEGHQRRGRRRHHRRRRPVPAWRSPRRPFRSPRPTSKKYGATPAYAASPPMTTCTSSPRRSSALRLDRSGQARRPRWRRPITSAPSAASQFYGKDSQFTHAMKYGQGLVTGTFIQWQNGKQVTVWPTDKANAKIKFPAFVKLPNSTPPNGVIVRIRAA